jgi:hypothetical protein
MIFFFILSGTRLLFFFILSGTYFLFPIADVAKMQKFKWNSSLTEMRRLFPSIVLKQCFLAK